MTKKPNLKRIKNALNATIVKATGDKEQRKLQFISESAFFSLLKLKDNAKSA